MNKLSTSVSVLFTMLPTGIRIREASTMFIWVCVPLFRVVGAVSSIHSRTYFAVKEDGWHKMWSGDVNELHAKYLADGSTGVGFPARKL
jgi:hypothetical protein